MTFYSLAYDYNTTYPTSYFSAYMLYGLYWSSATISSLNSTSVDNIRNDMTTIESYVYSSAAHNTGFYRETTSYPGQATFNSSDSAYITGHVFPGTIYMDNLHTHTSESDNYLIGCGSTTTTNSFSYIGTNNCTSKNGHLYLVAFAGASLDEDGYSGYLNPLHSDGRVLNMGVTLTDSNTAFPVAGTTRTITINYLNFTNLVTGNTSYNQFNGYTSNRTTSVTYTATCAAIFKDDSTSSWPYNQRVMVIWDLGTVTANCINVIGGDGSLKAQLSYGSNLFGSSSSAVNGYLQFWWRGTNRAGTAQYQLDLNIHPNIIVNNTTDSHYTNQEFSDYEFIDNFCSNINFSAGRLTYAPTVTLSATDMTNKLYYIGATEPVTTAEQWTYNSEMYGAVKFTRTLYFVAPYNPASHTPKSLKLKLALSHESSDINNCYSTQNTSAIADYTSTTQFHTSGKDYTVNNILCAGDSFNDQMTEPLSKYFSFPIVKNSNNKIITGYTSTFFNNLKYVGNLVNNGNNKFASTITGDKSYSYSVEFPLSYTLKDGCNFYTSSQTDVLPFGYTHHILFEVRPYHKVGSNVIDLTNANQNHLIYEYYVNILYKYDSLFITDLIANGDQTFKTVASFSDFNQTSISINDPEQGWRNMNDSEKAQVVSAKTLVKEDYYPIVPDAGTATPSTYASYIKFFNIDSLGFALIGGNYSFISKGSNDYNNLSPDNNSDIAFTKRYIPGYCTSSNLSDLIKLGDNDFLISPTDGTISTI